MEVQSVSTESRFFIEFQREKLQQAGISTISALGNLNVLNTKKLGLLCSSKCPGKLILQTHDLMASLHGKQVTVVSGFHSLIEKECLNILLRGNTPVIVCPARSLDGMRIPSVWKNRIEQGRMLLLSPFASSDRRATKQKAERRNNIVATLADNLFIPYAAPRSKTETLAKRLVSVGQEVLTIADDHNSNLLELGARGWH